MLTASRERGVIGGREIDAQHPEDRGQEALGLTQRSVEEETERQGGFDGEIGILELPAPPADASRCPRGGRVGREPEGDVASPHEGSVVLGPVPDAIRCRVLRMHSRLHIEIMTRVVYVKLCKSGFMAEAGGVSEGFVVTPNPPPCDHLCVASTH